MSKKYSKVNCMTYAQTNSILNEYGERGKDGRDYCDQIDDIKAHHWSLVSKRVDKMIKDFKDAPSKQRTLGNEYHLPF